MNGPNDYRGCFILERSMDPHVDKKRKLRLIMAGMIAAALAVPPLIAEMAMESMTGKAFGGRYYLAILVIEIVIFGSLFLLAKAGVLDRIGKRMSSGSTQEKILRRRGALLRIGGWVAALLFAVLGIFLGKRRETADPAPVHVSLGVACALPPLLLLLSVVLARRFARSLNEKRVEEMQQVLRTQREAAEQATRENLSFLKKCRALTAVYAALLALLGAAIALLGGWSSFYSKTYVEVAFILYAATVMAAGLSRIRFRIPTAFMEDDKSYVPREEFPYLYELAEQAARENGCATPVRIGFVSDDNIGVADLESAVSLLLSPLLLSILSEQELVSILDHEFAHLADPEQKREDAYANWLSIGKPRHALSMLTDLLFLYPDTAYGYRYFLYQFASSLSRETEADRAMTRHCDARTAASALIKTFYGGRYEYERGSYDLPSVLADEEPAGDLMTRRVRDFRERLEARAGIWNALIPGEIMSRSASHPTMKMRLDALGVTECEVLPGGGSEAYEREAEQSVEYLDRLMHENLSGNYEEDRKEYYLEPLRRVEEWTAAGKPLSAEGYRDVVEDLQYLGRNMEAEELCDRAISELPDSASHYAYAARGRNRLRRYDDRGLEDMYHAIYNNKNYIEDGLAEIGPYCCLTGNQKELDRYREEAVELMQKSKDEYSQLSELKKSDRLSAEELPDGMLETDLARIRAIDGDGRIRKIYLVRKTISDDFSTSVYVVKFEDGTGPEARQEILHGIFLYLDSVSDWQYSLFDYDRVARAKVEDVPGSLVYEKERPEA